MIKINKLQISILLLATALLFTQCNDVETAAPKGTYSTNFSSGKAFLESNAPRTQNYTKDASSSFQIKSSGGLTYSFPANSFYLNGTQVSGNVEIEITEYLSKADMIFSGVTTTSDDKILESGGMFKIEVFQGGQELTTAGQYYSVEIPSASFDWEMQVFRGEDVLNANGDEAVNWVQNDSSWVQQDSLQNDSGSYYLNLNFLSWCNLDKYYNASSGAQVRLKLPAECDNTNTTVYMMFDENSIVTLFGDATKEEFNSSNYILPLGWDIQLIATCVIDDELHYALVSSTITDPHLETVTTMTKITEEDLEALIKAL